MGLSVRKKGRHMNSHDRGVLIGMVWGDGCIKPKPTLLKNDVKTTYYEFVAGHSSKQAAYIEYKRNVFHSIMGGKCPKIHSRDFMLGEKQHTELRFSRQHKYFKLLHRWMYPDNKKTYTRRILDYLNPKGIAFWYMDDGSLSKNVRKNGNISSVEARLHTYCPEEQADTILDYFRDTWGIEGKKRLHKKSGTYSIAFNTEASKKLELLIKPYMTKSMYYKLPSTWVTRAQSTLVEQSKGEDIV
jgi:hypothetical protein